MLDANVDLIDNGQAMGTVAGSILNNGRLNVGAMRPFEENGRSYISIYKGGDPKVPTNYSVVPIGTNALLRRDEWKQLDQVLLDIPKERPYGFQDLVDKGLVYTLGNAMGTTVLEWHDISDGMEAVVSMDGVTRGKNDKVVFKHNYIPIPIIHSDYEINARTLAVSRNMENPLDTISAERATRKVLQKLENMLFTNTDYAFGETDSRSRNKIYSYINHPDRNQVTLTVAWNESGKTAAQIVADVVNMKDSSIASKFYGPWQLYIPTLYDTLLDEDYSVSGASLMTIRERIMKIDGIKGIKVVDTLPADNVLLVQMTSDVVRLIRGMGLQNVEWEVEGKMITKYKVLTIQVPQIRSDQEGRCGVTQLAGSFA